VPIRLDDLLASFRRHLRAAAKAPRTIELYSQSVRYFTRWLADRGRVLRAEPAIRAAIDRTRQRRAGPGQRPARAGGAEVRARRPGGQTLAGDQLPR